LPDFSVQLLRGVTYHVIVEPTDTSLPPYTTEMTADDGKELSIDYAKVRWTVQRFRVQGAPTDRMLAIRAVDVQTGEAVSSTGMVTDQPTTLVFGPSPAVDYRLELTASETHAKSEGGGSSAPSACELLARAEGKDTPLAPATHAYPVLRVARSKLHDDETGTHVLVMPEIPKTITYSGTVEVCAGAGAAGLTGMQMTLEAGTLLLDDEGSIEASYNATTMASREKADGKLTFCTEVLPGDYVVVVTPPENVECEIFAERRHIASDDGEVADARLSLRASATLAGTLDTPDRMAVYAAAVEARALGRDFDVKHNELSVASYNRSTQTATDEDGRFRLPLDVGSYDIVFKPAPESNYAWQVLYDVDIDAPSDTFATKVVLDAPVVLDAKLGFEGPKTGPRPALAGAQVTAYAKIESAGITRTIQVARAIADEDATVRLLISPQPHAGR
jgi:hypothetical protein